MEKKYITPEIDITEFEVEDLLTTSGGADGSSDTECTAGYTCSNDCSF